MSKRKQQKKRRDLINRKAAGRKTREALEQAQGRGQVHAVSQADAEWLLEQVRKTERASAPGEMRLTLIIPEGADPKDTLAVARLSGLLKHLELPDDAEQGQEPEGAEGEG